MSLVPLDSTPVEAELLQADGSWKPMAENSGFTVNRTAGTVTFTTAPGVSPVAGQDNVKITASHTVEGYADRINKCRIGIQFGVNGATDRLFLSGSPQLINYDWYSGLNDPTYWGDQAYSVLGQSDSAIVGYSIVNARLAAHKDSTDSDRNVIVREGTLVDNKPAFPIVNILQGEGAIGPYSFGYLGTEPLFLTKLGVYAITAQDITGEKIQPEPQLLPEREAAGGKRAGGSVRAGLQRHVLAVPERARVHSGRAAGYADGPLGPPIPRASMRAFTAPISRPACCGSRTARCGSARRTAGSAHLQTNRPTR